MSKGDCFEKALGLALDDPRLWVVHGLPVGTGPENKGKRFWHAWCERDDVLEFPNYRPTTITSVIDQSNDRDVFLPAALYYKAGRIEQVWRYSLEEAAKEALTHEHYGPWVEGWQDMRAG